MHISPEESGTARDAALNAGLQHLPALDAASANRQLESSTLMLLGHASEAAAAKGTGGEQPTAFASDILGAVADSSDSMIDDLLSDVDSPESSLDSFSAPQDWNVPPITTADGPLSLLPNMDDTFAFGSDGLFAPPSLLPTALAPSTSPSESPSPSSSEGQGFLAAENSSVSGSVDDLQSDAGDAGKTSTGDRADGGSGMPPSAAVSGGGQSGSVVSVTLIDRQQLLAAATANVAALAKTAARSTAESVVDQRLSDLRTEDDARSSARAAVFGS